MHLRYTGVTVLTSVATAYGIITLRVMHQHGVHDTRGHDPTAVSRHAQDLGIRALPLRSAG